MSPLLVSLLRRLLRSSSNERGSILLIAIVSVAVVSLLGLAVYDLALIESNFSAASVIDYRAYEIAGGHRARYSRASQPLPVPSAGAGDLRGGLDDLRSHAV